MTSEHDQPDISALCRLLSETAGVPDLYTPLTTATPEDEAARRAAAADITALILEAA